MIETYLNKVCVSDVGDEEEDDHIAAEDLLSTISTAPKQKPKADIPWSTLRYLIGEAMYGGRVSDFYDRRILVTYLNEYFGDFLFDRDRPFAFYTCKHELSEEKDDTGDKNKDTSLSVRDASPAEDDVNYQSLFGLPRQTSYEALIDAISRIPVVQTPKVLGLHRYY